MFLFGSAVEAGLGALRDQIIDFETGLDVIDVSGVAPGMLTFVGLDPFTGANQLRLIETATGPSIVQINLDANLAADAEIRVAAVTALTAADFVL